MKAYAMGWCLSALVVGTVLALGGGCGTDVVDFPSSGASAGGDTTATSTSGVMTSGSGGTGGGGVGGAAMTSGASTTSGSGSSMTSGTSMSSGLTTSGSSMTSSSTGGDVCPVGPNDATCVACVKTSCCADFNKCAGDASCLCWSGCLQATGDSAACFMQCGVPSDIAVASGTCVQGSCQQECTPAGTSSSSSSASASSSGSGTSGSSGSGAGSSSSASTGSGGNACPPAPNDTACAACAKANCCDEVTACAGDPKCVCWVQCVSQNPNNPFICGQANMCGAPDGTTTALSTCTTQHCQGSCP